MPVRQLLPQPHGFEGLVWIVIHFHPHVLAVADREDLGVAHVHGQAGGPGAPPLLDDPDHTVIACVADVDDFYRPIIEGGGPFSDEQPRSSMPS